MRRAPKPQRAPEVAVTVRLPVEVHAALRLQAQLDSRNLNGEVVHLLRLGLGVPAGAARETDTPLAAGDLIADVRDGKYRTDQREET